MALACGSGRPSTWRRCRHRNPDRAWHPRVWDGCLHDLGPALLLVTPADAPRKTGQPAGGRPVPPRLNARSVGHVRCRAAVRDGQSAVSGLQEDPSISRSLMASRFAVPAAARFSRRGSPGAGVHQLPNCGKGFTSPQNVLARRSNAQLRERLVARHRRRRAVEAILAEDALPSGLCCRRSCLRRHERDSCRAATPAARPMQRSGPFGMRDHGAASAASCSWRWSSS